VDHFPGFREGEKTVPPAKNGGGERELFKAELQREFGGTAGQLGKSTLVFGGSRCFRHLLPERLTREHILFREERCQPPPKPFELSCIELEHDSLNYRTGKEVEAGLRRRNWLEEGKAIYFAYTQTGARDRGWRPAVGQELGTAVKLCRDIEKLTLKERWGNGCTIHLLETANAMLTKAQRDKWISHEEKTGEAMGTEWPRVELKRGVRVNERSTFSYVLMNVLLRIETAARVGRPLTRARKKRTKGRV
jgi:hypothetical protein